MEDGWEGIHASIVSIYDKACAVRLTLQLIHEITPLQGFFLLFKF